MSGNERSCGCRCLGKTDPPVSYHHMAHRGSSSRSRGSEELMPILMPMLVTSYTKV